MERPFFRCVLAFARATGDAGVCIPGIGCIIGAEQNRNRHRVPVHKTSTNKKNALKQAWRSLNKLIRVISANTAWWGSGPPPRTWLFAYKCNANGWSEPWRHCVLWWQFSLWNPFSIVHSSGAPACRCPVNKRPNCKKSFAVNAKMWPKALSLKITVEFTTRHQPKADMTTALCDFVSPVRLFSFLPPFFFLMMYSSPLCSRCSWHELTFHHCGKESNCNDTNRNVITTGRSFNISGETSSQWVEMSSPLAEST